MRIRYENTIDDIIAFTNIHTFVVSRKALRRTLLLGSVFVVVCTPMYSWRHLGFGAILLAIISATMFYITWPWILRDRIRKRARKIDPKSYTGVHELTLEDEGIRETDENSEMFHKWSHVLRIVRTADRAFIYIGLGLAHVVPITRAEGDVSAIKLVEELAVRTKLDIIYA